MWWQEVIKGMQNGNFSFAILLFGIIQTLIMCASLTISCIALRYAIITYKNKNKKE